MRIYFFSSVLLLTILSSFGSVSVYEFALAQGDGVPANIEAAYRMLKEYSPLSIKVPTVVELPLSNEEYESLGVAVFDVASSTYEPSYIRTTTTVTKTPYIVESVPPVPLMDNMYDGRPETFTEFPITANRKGVVELLVNAQEPMRSSSLVISLPSFVTLPNTIQIHAIVDGEDKIVVAETPMTSRRVQFPETTSDAWRITLTYGQPLRIAELDLRDDASERSTKRFLRFLAYPQHPYRVFVDPDRYAAPVVGESGNLSGAKDIRSLPYVASIPNTAYIIADADGDTVPDIVDNCIAIANTDQLDVNENGRGDVCDDYDQDSLVNSRDNCESEPNRNQMDTDGDGMGDECDSEESRLTEKYTWLPWVGMGLAGLVIIGLFGMTAMTMRKAQTAEIKKVDQDTIPPPMPPVV